MKQVVLSMLISLTGLYVNFGPIQSSTILDAGEITRIKVTYVNQATGRGDEELKSVTSSEAITRIVAIANKTLSQSKSNSDSCQVLHAGYRSNIINLHFYGGDDYRGTWGIGPVGDGSDFFKYHAIGKYKYKCITSEERKEFLSLIGISEEEYERLYIEGWKK